MSLKPGGEKLLKIKTDENTDLGGMATPRNALQRVLRARRMVWYAQKVGLIFHSV